MPRKKFEETPYDPFEALSNPAPAVAETSPSAGSTDGTPAPVGETVPPARAPEPREPSSEVDLAKTPSGPVDVGEAAKGSSEGGGRSSIQPGPDPAPKVVSIRPPGRSTAPEGARSSARLTDGATARFKVLPDERREYEEHLGRLRSWGRSGIDFSQLTRAMWVVQRHAEPQLQKLLETAEVPPRPPKTDALAMAEYEEFLAELLVKAYRNMTPLR